MSGGTTIVIIGETSESRSRVNNASAPTYAFLGVNDATFQSLMVALGVVVFHILLYGEAKMLFSERDDFIQGRRAYVSARR